MMLNIKQLKQNGTIFVPQTVAEAVLIKKDSLVVTLDKVINSKVDSVTSNETSGLTTTRIGNNIDITHSNNVESITENKPLQISYDNHGHITNSSPFGALTIIVGNKEIIKADGSTNQQLNFGDDFQSEQNTITLKWDNGNT